MIPIPAPFVWIVRVVFAVMFLIVIIDLLLGGGTGFGAMNTGNWFHRSC